MVMTIEKPKTWPEVQSALADAMNEARVFINRLHTEVRSLEDRTQFLESEIARLTPLTKKVIQEERNRVIEEADERR